MPPGQVMQAVKAWTLSVLFTVQSCPQHSEQTAQRKPLIHMLCGVYQSYLLASSTRHTPPSASWHAPLSKKAQCSKDLPSLHFPVRSVICPPPSPKERKRKDFRVINRNICFQSDDLASP